MTIMNERPAPVDRAHRSRVYFVGDTSDRANWGSRATTHALRTMIERYADITHTLDVWEHCVGPKSPAHVPSIASLPAIYHRRNDETGPSNAPCTSSIRPDPDKAAVVPRQWSDVEPICDRVMRGEIGTDIAQAIQDTDIVVINGEGSFIDRIAPGRLKLLIGYLAATRFNTPCVLVNHTADLQDDVMRELAAHTYPCFDDVLFREPLSWRQNAAMRKGRPCDVAGDAIFTLTPAERSIWFNVVDRDNYFAVYPDRASGFTPARPYICLAGTGAYRFRPRGGFNPIPAFVALAERLRSFAQVLLVASEGADEAFLQPVAYALDLPIVGPSLPTPQALDLLAHASLYVGGRWHPALMALRGGTPTIMFASNSQHKTDGVLELAELEQPRLDSWSLHDHVDAVCDLARTYLDQDLSVRNALGQRAAALSESAWRNVRALHGQPLRANIGVNEPAAASIP